MYFLLHYTCRSTWKIFLVKVNIYITTLLSKLAYKFSESPSIKKKKGKHTSEIKSRRISEQ